MTHPKKKAQDQGEEEQVKEEIPEEDDFPAFDRPNKEQEKPKLSTCTLRVVVKGLNNFSRRSKKVSNLMQNYIYCKISFLQGNQIYKTKFVRKTGYSEW